MEEFLKEEGGGGEDEGDMKGASEAFQIPEYDLGDEVLAA